MINYAAGQHTLPSLTRGKKKGKDKQAPKYDGMIQTQLSFGQKPKDISQLKRLREMALEKLGMSFLSLEYRNDSSFPGPCVKINPNLHWLVGRLHIISYRGTEKPTKYCLPALLAGFKKWNFPEYVYQRDGSIWPTREDLLEYEEALYLDVEMENLPEDASKPSSAAPGSRLKTPATPVKGHHTPFETPRTKGSGVKASSAPTPIQKVEEQEPALGAADAVVVSEEVKESLSIQRAKHIKKLFKERIQPKWKALLARKDQEKGKAAARTPGLERFEAGEFCAVSCLKSGPLQNIFMI